MKKILCLFAFPLVFISAEMNSMDQNNEKNRKIISLQEKERVLKNKKIIKIAIKHLREKRSLKNRQNLLNKTKVVARANKRTKLAQFSSRMKLAQFSSRIIKLAQSYRRTQFVEISRNASTLTPNNIALIQPQEATTNRNNEEEQFSPTKKSVVQLPNGSLEHKNAKEKASKDLGLSFIEDETIIDFDDVDFIAPSYNPRDKDNYFTDDEDEEDGIA